MKCEIMLYLIHLKQLSVCLLSLSSTVYKHTLNISTSISFSKVDFVWISRWATFSDSVIYNFKSPSMIKSSPGRVSHSLIFPQGEVRLQKWFYLLHIMSSAHATCCSRVVCFWSSHTFFFCALVSWRICCWLACN
jgi:hypothetical protein